MDFGSQLKKYKDMADTGIRHVLDNEIAARANPESKADYILLRDYMQGGKKLRPVALLAAYSSFSPDTEKAVLPGLCVEFLHTSSIIFDDIMDEDDFRRARPAIHRAARDIYLKKRPELVYSGNIFASSSKRYGASRAIIIALEADAMSRKVLLESGFPAARVNASVELLTRAYIDLCEGQLLDLSFEGAPVTAGEYLLMNEKKTASLFAASLEIGAVLAGAGMESRALLREFGRNIAAAFQIQDDIIDLDPDAEKGRSPGSDIAKGKRTLPLIYALEKDKSVSKFLGKPGITPGETMEAMNLVMKTGAVDISRRIAGEKIQQGKECLEKIKLDPIKKEFLAAFADSLVNRNS